MIYATLKFAQLGISLGVIFLLSAPTHSVTPPVPSAPPVNCPPLEPRATVTPNAVRTANTIFLSRLTTPSLWWANEQFGGKLLDNWCAYPNEQRVDLVVNQQIWTILTYLERYEFVHHFGTTARDFNYNVRVFNQQRTLLAAYTCDYSTTPPRCNLWLDPFGRRSFQRNPSLN